MSHLKTKRLWQRLLFLLFLLSFAVFIIFLLNAYAFITQSSLTVSPVVTKPVNGAEAHLRQHLQLQTTADVIERDTQQTEKFSDLLQRQFPLLHKQLTRTIINGKSLIYHWSAASSRSNPPVYLFLAHYDVVNAVSAGWQHAPYAGVNDGEYIWGRGALDDKSSLLAMLEAVEGLLATNERLNVDLYFAFAHDEETGGEQGAKNIAHYFAAQGIAFDAIFDEGLVITEGIIELVPQPVALIGIAEKGLLNLELSVSQQGGHASMPGTDTAARRLLKGLNRLMDHPIAARITPPVAEMLQRLSVQASMPKRIVLNNLWLFEPWVVRQFQQAPATHAAVSTTMAVTRLSAATQVNVLPTQVKAGLNIRLLPGDSIQTVTAYVAHAVNDKHINIGVLPGAYEASNVSSTHTAAYEQLQKTVMQIFPDVLVSPGLVLAATDSRHYQHLSEQVYRFRPLRLRKLDLPRVHGKNERIAISDYQKAIGFYTNLFLNLSSRALSVIN